MSFHRVGMLDPDGELAEWEPLEPGSKVEGIEAHSPGQGIELLMVADADDPGSPSPLLSAPLPWDGRYGAVP